MKTIEGIVRDGRIDLSEPIAWPEGTVVRVRPIRSEAETSGKGLNDLGMTEDEHADDPESIARWITAFDAIPPLEMTPDEEAQWQAARQAQRRLDCVRKIVS